MTPAQERFFALCWRATLLLLPWQARFIVSASPLNGFSWEQGTLAFYVSWIPMLAAIVLAWKEIKQKATAVRLRPRVAVPVFVLLLASLLTSSGLATVLWWGHALLLGLFVAALLVREVPLLRVITWFLFSLLPHALLGIAQFTAQHVWGSSVLGIADQPSWKSGVSVVEYGEHRLLRAYGGFPHPNIFGGWLAVGLVFLPELIRRAKTHAVASAWMACGALFLYTLVLTFSRGAWLAAGVGLVLAFVYAFRHAAPRQAQTSLRAAVFIFLFAVGIAIATQWPAVATRITGAERLEQWSFTQRTSAIHDGFQAFKRHLLFGWGPGASLIGVAVVRTAPSPVPLEPPHLVPFVILLEVGILGFAAIIALFWFFFRSLFKQRGWIPMLPLLSVLVLLALTDHYLWTLWAGNILAAIGLFFLYVKGK